MMYSQGNCISYDHLDIGYVSKHGKQVHNVYYESGRNCASFACKLNVICCI